MMAYGERTIQLFVACLSPDLVQDRRHLHTVVFPRLRRMAERRGVTLSVVEATDDVDDPQLTHLVRELEQLADPATIFLAVLGRQDSPAVDRLPDLLADRFPSLLPFEGRSRLELLCRQAVFSAPAIPARFIRVLPADAEPTADDPGPDPSVRRIAALTRALQNAGATILDYRRSDRVGWLDELDALGELVLTTLWATVVNQPTQPSRSSQRREQAVLDENVQFTVYRPRVLRPLQWYPLLAFAHLAERRPDARADQPDPLAQVEQEAERLLAGQLSDFARPQVDSRFAIPRDGEISFVPVVPGVDFNPERRIFRWVEDVHREEFRLRARPELDGRTARGRLTVLSGALIVAEVDLAFRVDSSAASAGPAAGTTQTDQGRPYRRIFASYSHLDTEIVRQCELAARAFGDTYLRDELSLRSGDRWDERLLTLIDEADVFQLFWSRNSMRSPQVRREWEHALSLSRPHFVRPTFWEDPLPSSEQPRLPPDALRQLHFTRLGTAPAPAAMPTPAAAPASTPPPAQHPENLAATSIQRPAPTAGAAPRRGLRPLALLLPAAMVVMAVAIGVPLLGRDRPAAGPANSTTSTTSTGVPSSQPTTTATATATATTTAVMLSSITVPDAEVLSGTGTSTLYLARPGQQVRVEVSIVNRQLIPAILPVTVGLWCADAAGEPLVVRRPPTQVEVPPDTRATPGLVPVTTWRSEAIVVPDGCVSTQGTAEPDGYFYADAGDIQQTGRPTLTAPFRLGP
ncbi:hypothetical protein GCM10009841_29630 [Microlunatus panaciterrae]|uniref:TIR domain-containing protein n=1 Tax=Microlunatus panaciterrae TaxID=400768 RepID=A0ABS2RF45_9ACTN|nr:toll/interleukin-1 receptor domain-containing protein [Microlunatus panaciterrae]MBM7797623.1 hypothetical protein [Microlunatus panaciterrae]